MSKIKSALTILGAALASGATVVTTNQVVEQYNYNNIHEITTTDTYMINGEEVSKDEFDEAKNGIVVDLNLEKSDAKMLSIENLTTMSSNNYVSFLKTEGETLDYLLVYCGGDNNTEHACICGTYAQISNSWNHELAETANEYHERGFLHPEFMSTLTCARRNSTDDYDSYEASYYKSSLAVHKSDIDVEGFVVLKNVKCEKVVVNKTVEFASSSNDVVDLKAIGDHRYIPQYIISFESYNTLQGIALGSSWK